MMTRFGHLRGFCYQRLSGVLAAALLLLVALISAPLRAEESTTMSQDNGSTRTRLLVFTEEWAPVTYSENGKPGGMAVEVVREMLRRAGQATEISIVPWARGFKMVSEVPNVALFAVVRTQEREQLMTLIGPLLIARTEMYQKRDAAWRGKTDEKLRQAVVGTYRAAVFEKVARDNGFTHVELAATPDRSARMLLAGRVDLWIDSNVSAPSIIQLAGGNPGDLEPVMTLDVTELMLGVSRGTPAPVVLALENALHAMKSDGSYQRIFLRWFPNDTPPRQVVRVGIEPG